MTCEQKSFGKEENNLKTSIQQTLLVWKENIRTHPPQGTGLLIKDSALPPLPAFFPVHWTLQWQKLFDSFPLCKIMRKGIRIHFFSQTPVASPGDAHWDGSLCYISTGQNQEEAALGSSGQLALTCTDPSPPGNTGVLHSLWNASPP